MATEIIMPQMGESITEGTIVKWLKKPGDAVKKGEAVLEIGTDKVDAEVPSPADGTLTDQLFSEGDTVPIETVIAVLDGDGKGAGASPAKDAAAAAALAEVLEPAPEAADTAPAPVAPAPAKPAKRAPGQPPSAFRSPVVLKMAAEHGINLETSGIVGTGAGGRVTKKDLRAFIESGGAAKAAAGVMAPPAAPAVTFGPGESVKVEKMSRMRSIIAQRMVESRQTSAHVQTLFEMDMTAISKLRGRHKGTFQERNGVKLTYLPFLMKAITEAIQAYPVFNASVVGNEIHYKRDINLGIAVSVPKGLMVPVIRNCEERNLIGLARASQDVAVRARNNQINPDELSGGTFTITNPGQYGGLFGMPIINQPEVAILCFGGIEKRPVVVNGDSIGIRDMCYMALSFDHRIIDGAAADQFMARIKNTLQNGEWPDLV